MGKYSSDSDSSHSSRRRKSGKSHRRSSSRSSSGSHYSSKSRKSRKYKKSRRSRSKDKRSKSSREGSRERGSGRSRRRESNKRGKDVRRDDGRRRRGSSSPSPPQRDDSLMERLNKAAVEAMKLNKQLDKQNSVESQLERDKAIKEINASGFTQKSFSSTAPSDDLPAVVELPSLPPPPPQPRPQTDSILHQNLLMENHEDKLNRWTRKLFLIRQRSINGEPLQLA